MIDFAKDIIRWYHANRRNLPWRETGDPYRIWLSEVILQQTRVEQGLNYYLRFTEAYPDVKRLARASENEVLKLWQGLGYYSRARNLHYAARQVMKEFGGKVPGTYEDLRKLKGVGDYTAAAIASIAFGEPVAVVDGNVKRVAARVFGLEDTGSHLHKRAAEVMTREMDHSNPGDFNQAVMEFGALHCTPLNPDCAGCIFREQCFAYMKGLVSKLPKSEAKSSPKPRYFSYIIVRSKEDPHSIIMKKRTADDIWKNLYDFPLIETDKELDEEGLKKHPDFERWLGPMAMIRKSTGIYKHQLTHRTIYARFHFVEVPLSHVFRIHEDWEVIDQGRIAKLPVPRLIERFLTGHGLLG